jgi:hypothetical protein
MKPDIKDPVARVIALLAARRYEDLELLTKGTRLSAAEMERAIKEYGRELVQPPDDVWRLSDAVEVRNSQPRRWSIDIPLWTREEGRSDLTLEMTVIERQGGYIVELDGIHVL